MTINVRLCGVANIMQEENSTKSCYQLILSISRYLFHPFPTIRRLSAEELYLVMLTITSEKEEKEQIEELLLTTEWNVPLETGLKERVELMLKSIIE